MFDPLTSAAKVAWSGLSAQSTRVKIVSENLANSESTGSTAGSDPYRRKTISFENVFDHSIGSDTVSAKNVGRDDSAFRTDYRPGHPAADEKGMVKLPNVNTLIEMADMREAVRSYTANSQVIKQVREMTSMTIDLLRNG
ncbi:MAG: flagellar basal body rod protein FlgC [Hyphomicrobium sp.]